MLKSVFLALISMSVEKAKVNCKWKREIFPFIAKDKVSISTASHTHNLRIFRIFAPSNKWTGTNFLEHFNLAFHISNFVYKI